MSNILEIHNLHFTYPGTDLAVLKDLHLEIEKGDFVAIVGNNGCGKSTLCKAINGLIPHSITGRFTGEVIVNGKNTRTCDLGTIAKEAGYVYQDFENQIVRPTVLDDASYTCLNYGYENYLERGMQAIHRVNLDGKELEYVWELSGGQTHLLALAGALSLNPELLILDEPIAQLDPGNADTVYEVLKQLNEQEGKTILVIEHSTEYIAQYCNKVVFMKEGRVEWVLPTRDALQKADELLTSSIYPPQVTLATKALREEELLPTMEKLPITIHEAKETLRYLKLKAYHSETPPAKVTKELVRYDDIGLSYKAVKGEDKIVFDGLNLSINEGEKIALIGSNGAGKSTLMKMLVGLVKAKQGQILYQNQSIKDMRTEDLSKNISLVYQNPEQMFIMDNVFDDVSYAMKIRKVANWEEKAEKLMQAFHLEDLRDRDARLLSGGQMRRVSLAIGVALEPSLLLLDEPTANLDIATRKSIMNILLDLKSATETAVIATHDMQLVCEWADRIVVLHRGKVVADGRRDEIFRNEELLKTVGIRAPEIFHLAQQMQEEAYIYTIQDFLHALKRDNVVRLQNAE